MSQWKCHKWSKEDKNWKKEKGGRSVNWDQVCERNGINKYTKGNNMGFPGCGECWCCAPEDSSSVAVTVSNKSKATSVVSSPPKKMTLKVKSKAKVTSASVAVSSSPSSGVTDTIRGNVYAYTGFRPTPELTRLIMDNGAYLSDKITPTVTHLLIKKKPKKKTKKILAAEANGITILILDSFLKGITTDKKKSPPKSANKSATKQESKKMDVVTSGNCVSGNTGKIVFRGGVLLAKEFVSKDGKYAFDPTGWWASEKFDGYRAIWNGQSFVSRNGKPFNVPVWFSALMPPSIALDGELWMGRGCFQSCGLFRKKEPSSEEWVKSQVIYTVFDLPASRKPFEERMTDLARIVEDRCQCMADVKVPGGIATVRCPIQMTSQTKLTSSGHLKDMFDDVTGKEGEGIMIRQPGSQYEPKRSSTLLKLKVVFDNECVIVGYKPGTGKYTGMLGSFQCQLMDKQKGVTGKKFFVSGMTDLVRENYKTSHPKGTIITVQYNDTSVDGVPRHPRYLRKRDDHDL
jgi:hypothetical protein